jgi:osmotically inducible protein OsmC
VVVVGGREGAKVGDVSIDSRVSLLPTEERGFRLAVQVPTVVELLRQRIERQACAGSRRATRPISRSTGCDWP